jgi:starch synthase
LKPRILFVAAEAVPLAKTGGLGDAVSGLASALQASGVAVTVLLPGYPQAKAGARGLRQVGELRTLPGSTTPGRLLAGRFPDSEVSVVLLDNDDLYNRAGGPYADAAGREFADNAARFAALSHAAAHIAAGATGLTAPHLVHAHDWHAGLTALLMRQRGVKTPCIQTIHNLAFQGVFPMELAAELGIEPAALGADGIEFWGKLSYLKAGIRYAERITTVSRSYAREILTPRFGHGLDGLLQTQQARLSAIPNGIDAVAWDPAHDASLPKTYSATKRQGKAVCKRSLQRAFGLREDPNAPLLVHGSRLTTQKMADLALGALAELLAEQADLQVAILGCGEPAIEQGLSDLARRYPQRMGVHIGYEEDLAHLLHAGGDMLLHGSRFEPFGLTPVYAMRYGTVPIASRVGGMIDTVRDFGHAAQPAAGATGFLFEGETVADMSAAIRRALAVFATPERWQAMAQNGMRSDFSWDASALEYVQMYAQLTRGAASLAFAEIGAPVQDAQPARAVLAAPRAVAKVVAQVAAVGVELAEASGAQRTCASKQFAPAAAQPVEAKRAAKARSTKTGEHTASARRQNAPAGNTGFGNLKMA